MYKTTMHCAHNISRFMKYILHLELWCIQNYTIECVTIRYVCQDGRGRLLTHVTNYCEEDKKRQFHLFAVSKSDKASYSQPFRPAPDAYWCHVANRPLLSARSPSSPWANLLLPLGGPQLLDHCRAPIIYLHHHVIPAANTFIPSSSLWSLYWIYVKVALPCQSHTFVNSLIPLQTMASVDGMHYVEKRHRIISSQGIFYIEWHLVLT